jgi:outer membrane protein TolC
VRPSASLTLPIWRDRIAAEIAAAQAEVTGAEARLSGEQIALATELAAMLYMYRESVRNIDLYEERLVPRAIQSLDAAKAGYISGRADFLDLIEAQRSVLDFGISLAEARTQ